VDRKKKTGKSVMPDGLQGGLTPADCADLISYLETLRDKAPGAPKKAENGAPGAESGRVSAVWNLEVAAQYEFSCSPPSCAILESSNSLLNNPKSGELTPQTRQFLVISTVRMPFSTGCYGRHALRGLRACPTPNR